MTSALNHDIQTCHRTEHRLRVKLPSLCGQSVRAGLLEKRLLRAPSVRAARVRPVTGSIIIYFKQVQDNGDSAVGMIQSALDDIDRSSGPTVRSSEPPGLSVRSHQAATPAALRRSLLRVLALTAFTVFHLVKTFAFRSPLGAAWLVAGTLIGALNLFRRALADLSRHRVMSANTFLSGATLLAICTGESAAALEVLWIQEVGQLLEDYVQDRSRRAIRNVILLHPQTAFVLIDDSEIETPITDIQTGDILCVHAAEKIAVDGSVVHGEALVDESHISGRAEPQWRKAGDRVFAGTDVQQGKLHIKAEKVGEQTYLARVVRTAEESLANRADVERQADRLATRLVGLGTATSVVTLGLTGSVAKALAVQLALASPCATVMAASTTVTAALASAARQHVLIKGGVYLERLAGINCICFDKTGTLTDTLPDIVTVRPRTKAVPADRVHALAAAAQCHNTHPIARALVQSAPPGFETLGYADGCETLPGLGVRARIGKDTIIAGSQAFIQAERIDAAHFKKVNERLKKEGCTVVFVARNGKLQGLIGLKVRFRKQVESMLAYLRRDGVTQIHLLSGDTTEVVTRAAHDLGLTHAHGDMLPEDKARHVKQLVRNDLQVAMVGDGINDAPALAQATIGIAMGAGGAEAAIEAADIALADNRLERIIFARELSHRTLRIIEQNHWFAVSTDLLGAMLAIAGILPPILSGASHILHTLVILANSSRILAMQPVQATVN